MPLNVVRILEWSAAAGRNCGNERDADVSFVPARKNINKIKIIKEGENVWMLVNKNQFYVNKIRRGKMEKLMDLNLILPEIFGILLKFNFWVAMTMLKMLIPNREFFWLTFDLGWFKRFLLLKLIAVKTTPGLWVILTLISFENQNRLQNLSK